MKRFGLFFFGALMLSFGASAWAAPVEEFRMPGEGQTDCAFVQETLQKRLGYGHIGAFAFQAFMLYTGFCETPDVARAEAQFEKVLPTGAPVAQLWLARKRHLAGDAEGAEKALIVAAYRWAKEELESYRLVTDRLLPRSLQPTANAIAKRILGPKDTMAPIEKLRLGKALKSGDAEIQDAFAACTWLGLAARAKLPEAEFLLSKWQFLGDGIRQNVSAASRSLLLLAERDHPPTLLFIGQETMKGKYVKRDAPTAYYAFLRAQETGANVDHWLEQTAVLAEEQSWRSTQRMRDLIAKGDKRPIILFPLDEYDYSSVTLELDLCFKALL